MIPIDWRMSAALENVPRGGAELPEVTSLEGAVRAWAALDDELQAEAVLTPEHPVPLGDGESVAQFAGKAVRILLERLEERGEDEPPAAA